MHYTIKPGDTIPDVTRRLGTDFATLKKTNPGAVGKSGRTGDWIVKAGATVTAPTAFADALAQASSQRAGKTVTAAASPDQTSSQSGTIKHILKQGETVWELATTKYHVTPEAILKLNNITNPMTLQVGQELSIPSDSCAGNEEAEEVVASWYGRYHHGRPMANGQPFNMHALTIAHKDIPLGTRVELENPQTGEKAEAVVTDRGPYVRGRDVDLSYRLAKQLSLARQGVGNLKMRVL